MVAGSGGSAAVAAGGAGPGSSIGDPSHAYSATRDGGLRKWDIAGGGTTVWRATSGSRVNDLAVPPGFSWGGVVTAHSDGRVRVWDTRTGGRTRQEQVGGAPAHHRGAVLGVELCPVREYGMYSSGQDGVVQRWDRRQESVPLFRWTHPEVRFSAQCGKMRVEDSGRYLVLGAMGGVFVLDTKEKEVVLQRTEPKVCVRDIAWSSVHKQFAAVSVDRTIRIWK